MLLTDQEAGEIRRGIEEGLRGPVLLTWIRRLLDDREERVRSAAPRLEDGESGTHRPGPTGRN